MLNKQILIGRVGRDPELRYIGSGTAISETGLATDDGYTKNGEKVKKTTWHNLVVWGRSGESFAEHVKKGDLLYVEGRLEKDEYEKDGEKRLSVRTVVSTWRFIPGTRPNGNNGATEEEVERISIPLGDDAPF